MKSPSHVTPGGGGLPGDVNGDAKVNVSDAVVVLQSVVRQVELTAPQIPLADVNKDAKVDVSDAVQILRKAVNLPVDF